MLCGLGFLFLIFPQAKRFGFRLTLALACLMTMLGLPYIYLFDLSFSNRFVFASVPALVSLTLFSMHFYRTMTTKPVAPGRVAISFVLFLSAVWGNFVTVYSARYCAFGASAYCAFGAAPCVRIDVASS